MCLSGEKGSHREAVRRPGSLPVTEERRLFSGSGVCKERPYLPTAVNSLTQSLSQQAKPVSQVSQRVSPPPLLSSPLGSLYRLPSVGSAHFASLKVFANTAPDWTGRTTELRKLPYSNPDGPPPPSIPPSPPPPPSSLHHHLLTPAAPPPPLLPAPPGQSAARSVRRRQ